jgi:hypothetical protein
VADSFYERVEDRLIIWVAKLVTNPNEDARRFHLLALTNTPPRS